MNGFKLPMTQVIGERRRLKFVHWLPQVLGCHYHGDSRGGFLWGWQSLWPSLAPAAFDWFPSAAVPWTANEA